MIETGAAQFRKKPLVIEAVQWTGDNIEALKWWGAPVTPLPSSRSLIIGTLEDGPNHEAVHVADRGDWIIKGVKGEFYPIKRDIFEATYEAVVEEPSIPKSCQHGKHQFEPQWFCAKCGQAQV